MADNDLTVLEGARDALFTLEREYRLAVNNADLERMTALSPQLDAAADQLSAARLNLLKQGQIATDADVAEMRRIKGEIDQAAETQQLVEGAIRFVAFLRKFV